MIASTVPVGAGEDEHGRVGSGGASHRDHGQGQVAAGRQLDSGLSWWRCGWGGGSLGGRPGDFGHDEVRGQEREAERGGDAEKGIGFGVMPVAGAGQGFELLVEQLEASDHNAYVELAPLSLVCAGAHLRRSIGIVQKFRKCIGEASGVLTLDEEPFDAVID